MTLNSASVWQWDLDDPRLAAGTPLSPEEQARANRFIVPHAKRRFTAGRSAVRRTLAAWSGVSASELVLETGPNGKPFVRGGPFFNLSHSGPMALFVVAEFSVGIDVEATRPVEPGLANSVFTPAELAYLATLPADGRDAAFFRGWTRKEAVIKAKGGSIADLQAIAVLPDVRLAGWQVTDLPVSPGYAAAVAAPRRGWTISWQGPENDAR